ncbi:MAG: class A beta-lactamase-related serine hydrolase [Marinilabiliales bacterium]|nr:MAG: class A beta-lactamase-related serine hydrolase [Marinilabiliales bacterium]
MRRLFTRGIFLKIILFTCFYLWDVAMSSSGGSTTDRVLRSEQIQPISYSINNQLSDLDDFRDVEYNLAFLLGKFDMKGASVAVAKDGRLVYARGIGYANTESNELVEPRHMFRVASISKLITATAIMYMAESGMLSLKDNVFGHDGILNDSIYLDYTDNRVERITVLQLLNHSAGWNRRFGDHMFMPHTVARSLGTDPPVEVPDIIRFALGKRLHYTPGTRTSYSNLGYAILGEVISKVSGMGYEEYVRQAVLYPLGIQDMRIGGNLEEERFENEVRYYEQDNAIRVNSFFSVDSIVPKSYGGNDIRTLGAAGGWIASPAELLRLVVAIDGNPRVPDILSAESIKLMTDSGLSGGHTIGWTGTDARGNWWRTGTFAGTSALVMRQNNGLTWAVFFNSSTYRGTTLAREITREVQTALNRIKEWPDHDLFYHLETMPFLYPDIAELR